MDLVQEKVDNRLICLGFCFSFILNIFSFGTYGLWIFFSGMLLPLFSLLPLFYFRMIGGGDIKLLAVLGSFLGYPKVLGLLLSSLLTGGILSAAFLIFCGNLKERISYFINYFYDYEKTGIRKHYRRNGLEPENFHFTVPIYVGVILLIGGCY